ncbi:hypothetical protein J1N35_005794 [Gossypium stocksii]|uniref:Uncharacterized protein n=1 Tax=Gossypium stocksii TaxID=47602 RepID=A0A9D3WEJ8_9ROSI|nr:hypothetical protein J1N35_005794 [Gossypium stocksii]
MNKIRRRKKERRTKRNCEEILKNKGSINEASIERITRSKDTLILKKTETSKIRKGKAKDDSKRTNINAKTSLWRKLKDVKEMVNSINNRQIKLVEDTERFQNLFYAYTRAWNSSIVATLGQLSQSLLSEFPVFLAIIYNYNLSSSDNDLEDRDRPVASLPIVQIDSLFEDGIFANQEETVVKKKVDAVKAEVVVEEEVFGEEEEVAENEKEKE